MSKKTVAVLFGGYSPEYEVSLSSAYSIIEALDREKYEIVLLGITRSGEWYRYNGPVDDIPCDKWHADGHFLTSAVISPSRGSGIVEIKDGSAKFVRLDAVFPVLHGGCGEDGTIQGLCELAGLPVVGSGSAASALCMDKDRSHKLAALCGIRIPESICYEHRPDDDEILSAARGLKLPLFVKPVKAGSSFGITKADDYDALIDAVDLALSYDNAFIIEESIDGFETGCAVVGNHDLITGRIDEIELANGFFNYEEKYARKTSKIHLPARIDSETETRLQEAAKAIYRALGCRGYARIDLFLTREREIVFNEANTIPGFTSQSRFPNMMKAAGVDFRSLVDNLIGLALEKQESGVY